MIKTMDTEHLGKGGKILEAWRHEVGIRCSALHDPVVGTEKVRCRRAVITPDDVCAVGSLAARSVGECHLGVGLEGELAIARELELAERDLCGLGGGSRFDRHESANAAFLKEGLA